MKNALPSCGQDLARGSRFDDRGDGAEDLLSADTFFVSSPKSVGKVYLHAVVDTFGSYAFGFLHVSKQPEVAVAVLHRHGKPRPFSTGNHATNVVRIRSVSRAQRPLV